MPIIKEKYKRLHEDDRRIIRGLFKRKFGGNNSKFYYTLNNGTINVAYLAFFAEFFKVEIKDLMDMEAKPSTSYESLAEKLGLSK